MDHTTRPPTGKTRLTDADRARLAWATIRQQRRLGIAINRRAVLTLMASLVIGKKGGRS